MPEEADVVLARHEYMGGDYASFYDEPVVVVTDQHAVLAPDFLVGVVRHDYPVVRILTEADVEVLAAPEPTDANPSPSDRSEGLAALGRDETDESAPAAQDLSTAALSIPLPAGLTAADVETALQLMLRVGWNDARVKTLEKTADLRIENSELHAAYAASAVSLVDVRWLARRLCEQHDTALLAAARATLPRDPEPNIYAEFTQSAGHDPANARRVFGQPYGP